MQPNSPISSPNHLTASLAALTDQVNLATLQAIEEGEDAELQALSQIEELSLLAFSCYQQLAEGEDQTNLGDRVAMPTTSPIASNLFQRFAVAAQAKEELELANWQSLKIKAIKGTHSCQLELFFQGKKAQLIVSDQRLTALTSSPIIADSHLSQILLALPKTLREEIHFISIEVLKHLSLASLPTLLELCPKSFENTCKLMRQLPAFHDWTVGLSDGQVGITSAIIALKSPYFASLFRSQMCDSAAKKIDLAQDMNVENFQLYLDVAYDQAPFLEAELDLEVFLQLIKIAHYFNDEGNEHKMIHALYRQLSAAAEGDLSYEEILSLIAFRLSLKELEGTILQPPMVNWLLEAIEKNIDIYIGKMLLSFSLRSTKEEKKLFKKQLKEINGAITSLGAHWPEPKKLYDNQLELLSPLTHLQVLTLTQAQFLKAHLIEHPGPSTQYSTRFVDRLSQALPQLKALKFKHCTISLEAFQDFYSFQEMERLEFENCSYVSACREDCSLTADSIRTAWVSYLQFLPKLKKLTLLHPIEHSGEVVNYNEYGLRKIRGLTLHQQDLAWLPKSSIEELSATLTGIEPGKLINPLPSTPTVSLRKLMLNLPKIFDSSLATSLNNMPQLQNLHLHFRGAFQVIDNMPKVTSSALRSLKLSFANPELQSAHAISNLIDCFPTIETLEMQDEVPQIYLMLNPLLAKLNVMPNFKQLIIPKDLHSVINKNDLTFNYNNIEFVAYLSESDLSIPTNINN